MESLDSETETATVKTENWVDPVEARKNLAKLAIITVLLLVSLKLGAFTDYTFEVGTFAFKFVASSMPCSPMTTLPVFGSKNLCLGFYRPGSLVVLTSSVCCLPVLLDAETLAVQGSVLAARPDPRQAHSK